jgi:hypothetical protein
MSEKREFEESEAVTMQQGYPSPTINETDGGPYYQSGGGHREADDIERQADVEGPHQQHDHQEVQEHHDLQHHQSRPSVSAEELQLAAQLTQGLAPMMAAHNQMHEQMANPEPEIPVQDPHLQNQIQEQLQGEEHNLQSQPHQYVPNPQAQPHMAPHIPMDHLQAAYPLGDNTPPRKRSKVSRACDECRRKKIKCDAMSEGGEEPCSNCRRSNARCLFSRVPQKRGPSKG